ncbi:hypothetical protein EYF80_040541 [Liparis tanakae]|uniref:Uncharacterized protein n=1 Tax=Liparis tanakae TaxID=230148 RepID=A0A4Z2G8E8_9TELE|nr:hypothetical protein EYF80_040541 [Liparis tanakae]
MRHGFARAAGDTCNPRIPTHMSRGTSSLHPQRQLEGKPKRTVPANWVWNKGRCCYAAPQGEKWEFNWQKGPRRGVYALQTLFILLRSRFHRRHVSCTRGGTSEGYLEREPE